MAASEATTVRARVRVNILSVAEDLRGEKPKASELEEVNLRNRRCSLFNPPKLRRARATVVRNHPQERAYHSPSPLTSLIMSHGEETDRRLGESGEGRARRGVDEQSGTNVVDECTVETETICSWSKV